MADSDLIIKPRVKRGPSEACASFSHKLNLANYGGPQYESVDLFASRKVQCAPEDLDALTIELHEECIAEVEERGRQYILDMRRRQAEREKRRA